MRINLIPHIPTNSADTLAVTKNGDVLTINGEAFDFSMVPDGGTIPAGVVPCEFIVGPIERINGALHLTLILPIGWTPEPWQAFPDPIIDPSDGPLDLPWDTYSETTSEKVAGGTKVTVATYRWHQEPEIETNFVPDPVQPQETTDVDA